MFRLQSDKKRMAEEIVGDSDILPDDLVIQVNCSRYFQHRNLFYSFSGMPINEKRNMLQYRLNICPS